MLGGDGNTYINRPNGAIYFRRSNNDEMVITTAGNFGIGTLAPDAKLQVVGSGNGFARIGADCGGNLVGIGFNGAFGNCTNYSVLGGDGNTYINRPNGAIYFRQSNNDQMVITTAGNVGIGTLNPAATLDVVGSIRMDGSGNGLVFPDGTVQKTAQTTAPPCWCNNVERLGGQRCTPGWIECVPQCVGEHNNDFLQRRLSHCRPGYHGTQSDGAKLPDRLYCCPRDVQYSCHHCN
jgi:hypothetical protein